MAEGLLIALEGIDGAGTSTQVTPLAEHLRGCGFTVHTTAEPSPGPVGQLIRSALRGNPALSDAALALMFAADRLHHNAHTLLPVIEKGGIVITDRYMLSSFAYQASALSLPWVRSLNEHARLPDLNLFFRVTPDTAAKRRAKRGEAADQYETDAQQKRIAAAYESLVAQGPQAGPVTVIDAEAPIAAVTAQLCQRVDALIAHRGLR